MSVANIVSKAGSQYDTGGASVMSVANIVSKAGSQYDTGGASVMSVANIVRESIFTTQILFLMSNF